MNASDFAVAGFELALARLRLQSERTQALIAASPVAIINLDARETELVRRIAYMIPRVAARLPWRADCLVQALAAQSWLSRHRIRTSLTLGVPRNKPVDFVAHAWLTAGDRIVTGGDVSDYVPLSRLKVAEANKLIALP